jgi:hypothetical protein
MNELLIDNREKIFDRGLNIRVVENSRGNQLKDWFTPCSREELRQFGFDCFLKDLLTGPEHVINTLCHSNNIHSLVNIPPRNFFWSDLGSLSSSFQSISKSGR